MFRFAYLHHSKNLNKDTRTIVNERYNGKNFTLLYDPGEEHTRTVLETRRVRLEQDLKEATVLVHVSRRLVERTKVYGASLLTWFPSVLRHMLQTHMIGQPSTLPKKQTREDSQGPESEVERERDSVLRVLVMLEVFNQCLERLYSEDIPTTTPTNSLHPNSVPGLNKNRGKKRHTETLSSARVQTKASYRYNEVLRSRFMLEEIERISDSAVDLVKQLEEEIHDLDEYCKRLEIEHTLYSPIFSPSGRDTTDPFSSSSLSTALSTSSSSTSTSARPTDRNDAGKRGSYGHSFLDSNTPALPSLYDTTITNITAAVNENTTNTTNSLDKSDTSSSTVRKPSAGIPGLELLTAPQRVRRPQRPDLTWAARVLTPAIYTRSHQRAHSFPYALGLLARCVISGTMKPRPRLRGRARSLDDTFTPGVAASLSTVRRGFTL
ncbi:hypothetical protein PNOK_0722400 [Pyrrhoderma noxium]|uniref:Uncharacterized protein n=1 Tax=Pyrrhoderma noxium TaxID=2282107 RepID=A0A286UC58_9AGAM|nr:hypothetical protein PNOK_0722400 [Pyrrhoderma noxium]